MRGLTRGRTVEPISPDEILRGERGREKFIFSVRLTTSRIGTLYTVDPHSSGRYDRTYNIHTN